MEAGSRVANTKLAVQHVATAAQLETAGRTRRRHGPFVCRWLTRRRRTLRVTLDQAERFAGELDYYSERDGSPAVGLQVVQLLGQRARHGVNDQAFNVAQGRVFHCFFPLAA